MDFFRNYNYKNYDNNNNNNNNNNNINYYFYYYYCFLFILFLLLVFVFFFNLLHDLHFDTHQSILKCNDGVKEWIDGLMDSVMDG